MKSRKNDMLARIKRFCESCCGSENTGNCNDYECPAFSFRCDPEKGISGLDDKPTATKIKNAIRNRCLECFGDDARGVLLCESVGCELWVWRLGTGERCKKPKTIEDKLFDTKEEIDTEDLLFG